LPLVARITERITTQGSPSAPSGAGLTVRADLQREYAAGGNGVWSTAFLRGLPLYIDDITRDFGADLYDRMCCDARVSSEVDNFRAAILEDGVVLAPAVDDASADGHALAATIRDAAERMLDDLDTPLDDVLWDLASAVALGNRVAEQVYAPGDVAGKPGLVLRALRPKPRDAVSFVVDRYNRLVGFLARVPGRYGTLPGGLFVAAGGEPPPNLLPRGKFAHLPFRPVDGDPRGTSVLRPAYTPWNLKQQILIEHVKYLTQFASPILVGILGEGAQNEWETGPDGQPTGTVIRAVDVLLTQLIALRNGTALAVPFGTAIQELFSQGTGAAFLDAFAMYNRDITLAISGQTLATTEGEHQARAAAQVHQDTKNTRVRQAKKALARLLRRDVLRQWATINFGEQAAALTPLVSLGGVEEEDLTPRMNAVANLQRAGWFTPSQKPQVDGALGLPAREPSETAVERERFTAPPQPADPSAPTTPTTPTTPATANQGGGAA